MMDREYRLVRVFDMERDGMGGRDSVELGRVSEQYARGQIIIHRSHAKDVWIEWRPVGVWRKAKKARLSIPCS